MPAVWFALKRSLQCKSEPTEVHDPKANEGAKLSSLSTKKTGRSGCSRTIANLRDVIHGSKRHVDKPEICSPRSIGSSELLNPITHEVVLNNSTCELKIMSCGFPDVNKSSEIDSRFENTLKQGSLHKAGVLGSPIRRSCSSLSRRRSSGFGSVSLRTQHSFGADSLGISSLICHMCTKQFTKWESAEEHHLSKHAVTELVEGDSSRKIVELICKTSWAKTGDNNCGGIERTLKVNNMQNKLADFEEYREMVKIKANKLAKKHPRCLADGNELLRFHGTTVECAIGSNGSSSLCNDHKCSVCRILRHGFSTKEEVSNGKIGVFTASTSGRALELRDNHNDDSPSARKALIVCRVIAGRVHKPLENVHELVGQSGFDSLAGKVGVYSNIQELYLLNARALLPCFVVICK